jgi:probable F420-dependent oxidoreductase
MQFDLWMPTASPMTTPELLDTVAEGAQARDVGTIWVGEHVVLFGDYDSHYPYAADGRIPAPPGSGLLEPLVTLTYLAARTSTVRLGTAMLLLPQRNPVYVAKEVSTLDLLSGGRVDLGIGVGWLKEEFEALNVPWERRGARTDEYLQVLRTLWVDDTSSFHGETYDLAPCEMFPKPVQQPHPPIHVGGETRAALRRAARHAQGWHTFNRSPEELVEGLAALDVELEAAGRTRGDLHVTVCPYFNQLTPEWVERYVEAGADAVAALFFAFTPDDVARAFDDLEDCRRVAQGA